jgi:hypothetical protein
MDPVHTRISMGQQRNKVEKRRRRATYNKRLKSRRAAGLTPKKRTATKAEAPSGDETKKKAAKKKVVKKKVAAKAAPEAEAPATEAGEPTTEA